MKYEKRVCFVYCLLLLCVSLLLLRLYSLSDKGSNKAMQVLRGQYNSSFVATEHSGFVYDRNLKLLSHKKVGEIIIADPGEFEAVTDNAVMLSEYSLLSDANEIYDSLLSGIPFTVSVKEDMDAKEMCKHTKGLYTYPVYQEANETAVHFMGYCNSAGKGMSGLRFAYSEILESDMKANVKVSFTANAKNRGMSPVKLEDESYINCDGIITTLDKDLQMFCDSFGDDINSGCIVAADVKTGQLLSVSSFPLYTIEDIPELLDSDNGELVNRAVCSFTPGSVFKIVVAAAALEFNEELYFLEYECTGSVDVDGKSFRCHNHDGHGKITMQEAFENSCNTYFINLGRITGLDRICGLLDKMGLDEKTRADFLCESINFFPDKSNQNSCYLANISFGQGDLCFSPLDMVKMAICAVSGHNRELKTIMGTVSGGETKIMNDTGYTERVLSPKTVARILCMMKGCVDKGTGMGAKSETVNLGGKTATAQTGRFNGDNVEYVHKWFCGVYPAEKPRIVVCVLCDSEDGKSISPAVVFGKIGDFLAKNGF